MRIHVFSTELNNYLKWPCIITSVYLCPNKVIISELCFAEPWEFIVSYEGARGLIKPQ